LISFEIRICAASMFAHSAGLICRVGPKHYEAIKRQSTNVVTRRRVMLVELVWESLREEVFFLTCT
jgi:hypothetical protein